jgi:NAD(P)-dependent dehydrogenase (short-subunit alcohol dehydrogenase family)
MVEGDLGGRLDVLVNNAGFGLLGPVETQSPEQIRQQFEVNFFGPVLLTRLLLPALRAAKGRVLNISSIGGRMTFPFYGTYNATKHALESHTEGLYYEVRRQGVQVGLIEPGAFRTEFAARSLVFGAAARDPGTPYAGQSELFEAWMRRNMSLAGDADKVARVIARLCDSRRVPIRTLVGLDARLAVAMRWLLPEHWRVALMERLFRRAVLGA